jgi:hypothetical protein
MLSVASLTFLASACKKCFHCYNECLSCTYADSSSVATQTYCRDSFNTDSHYQSAVNLLISNGYVCSSTASTYTRDFCVNKAGEETYPDYYNKGNKIKCDEK